VILAQLPILKALSSFRAKTAPEFRNNSETIARLPVSKCLILLVEPGRFELRPPVSQTGGAAQHRHFKSRSKRAPDLNLREPGIAFLLKGCKHEPPGGRRQSTRDAEVETLRTELAR